MTIDEAIKLLNRLQGELPEQLATPMQQALKLSIEALERLRELRQDLILSPTQPLPSETEK